MNLKKLFLLTVLLSSASCNLAHAQSGQDIAWSCSEGKQFKTTGTTEKVSLTWESKSFDMDRQTSLPGSLRYKNTNSGFDLVVLGNKAMLFNIKTGTRMADFCQTAEMRAGKLPHLFAGAEAFIPQ
jgi:hypothetical protein